MLKKITNPKLVEWHGKDAINHFYVGDGFVIKPCYSEHGDRSGHYISGYEVYYYGTLVTTYPAEYYEYNHKKRMAAIAKLISNQLKEKKDA